MISSRFEDFDAFAATVRGVDCVMLLQNPQYREWNIDQANFAGINVQFGQVGSGNIVEGRSWSNGYLLYLPLTGTVGYLANGSVIGKNAVAILEPGCEFCISTKDPHNWCTIFVPTNRFIRGGDLLESSIAKSAPEMARCRVTRSNPQLAFRFLSTVRQVMKAAVNSSRFESSPAAESAAVELTKISHSYAMESQVDYPHKEGRPKIQRGEIVQSCRHLLEERADDSIRVDEMATAAGVSERTLRTAFREYFGMGPVRYLKLRQLNLVHRTLRATNPAMVSVTDALVEHGVWEFGRFASQYRHLFGELPSDTLRKRR